MGLRIIKDKNITYYLGLGNHFNCSRSIFKNVNLKELDILVLEDSGSSTAITGSLDSKNKNTYPYRQYYQLFKDYTETNEYPLLCGVDIRMDNFSLLLDLIKKSVFLGIGMKYLKEGIKTSVKDENLSRREVFKTFGKLGAGFLFASPIFNIINSGQSIVSEKVLHANNLMGYFDNIVGFRNFVSAIKVTDFVVPYIKRKKEKVNVGLIYGAGHSGIEQLLKYERLRKLSKEYYRSKIMPALNSYMHVRGEKDKLNEVRLSRFCIKLTGPNLYKPELCGIQFFNSNLF